MSDASHAPATPNRKIYTVFCVDKDGLHPTTHISSQEAASSPEAGDLGRQEAASDWECDVDQVALKGIALGKVEIIEWDDEA